MSTVIDTAAPTTLADVIDQLGGIALERIRWQPYPGTATLNDALKNQHCELIDGVLVEKAMGRFEGRVGQVLAAYLEIWISLKKLDVVISNDAMTPMRTGNMRIPDVYFVRWERIPGNQVPEDAVTAIPPHVAIEVLSEGNTKKEMERKRQEFFASGVEQVWRIDPRPKTVAIWTSVEALNVLTIDDILTGGASIPGFELSVKELFAAAQRGSVDLELIQRWLSSRPSGN